MVGEKVFSKSDLQSIKGYMEVNLIPLAFILVRDFMYVRLLLVLGVVHHYHSGDVDLAMPLLTRGLIFLCAQYISFLWHCVQPYQSLSSLPRVYWSE